MTNIQVKTVFHRILVHKIENILFLHPIFTFSHYGDVVARGSIVFTKKIDLLILPNLHVLKVRIQKKWFLGVVMSVCRSVCLSVCRKHSSKTTGPIWTKFWI